MATASTTTRVTGRLAPRLTTRKSTVCLRCQYRAIISCERFTPSSTRFNASRGYASESIAQRLRRRLRGSKQPEQLEEPAEPAAKPEAEVDERDGYVPAKTWDGLPRIGGKREVKAWQTDLHWQGFMLPTKLQSKDDLFNALHRALIEVFTLKEAGLLFTMGAQWGDHRVLEASRRPSLSQDKDGRVKVKYPDNPSRWAVIDTLVPRVARKEPVVKPLIRRAARMCPKPPWPDECMCWLTKEVDWIKQLEAQDDDYVVEPEEPSFEDIESIFAEKTAIQNHDVSNTKEVDWINQVEAQDDDYVVEPDEEPSLDDIQKTEDIIQFESNTKEMDWINQVEAQDDDYVIEPEEEPSLYDIQKSEDIVQFEPILEENTAIQNHDVSNTEEGQRVNQAEAQDDDVFEPEEEPSLDDIQKSEDVVQLELNTKEVQRVNQVEAQDDDYVIEPEKEPPLDDIQKSQDIVQFESNVADKTAIQNHDVSNIKEVQRINQTEARDDYVVEPKEPSLDDIQKSEDAVQFESIVEDKTAMQNDDVFEPEKPSSDDIQQSENTVQPESIPEDMTTMQNHDVSNTEEVDWINQAEAQDDDVFEPEEPSSDDIQQSESTVQPGSTPEDKMARQNRDTSYTTEVDWVNEIARQNRDTSYPTEVDWVISMNQLKSSLKNDMPIMQRQSDADALEDWIKIVFPDPAVKFAIFKRVMRLTGHRIPDPAAQDINSARALIGHLIRKPKPKKVAERLSDNEELVSLPNVKVRERRLSFIDKEKEVGRWKVIEKELRERGLPVVGRSREALTPLSYNWTSYQRPPTPSEENPEAR